MVTEVKKCIFVMIMRGRDDGGGRHINDDERDYLLSDLFDLRL